MKIEKVISNNVVLTFLDDGQEALVMGKGIGYGKANAEYISTHAVEKIFRLDTPELRDKLSQLLVRENVDFFILSEQIIHYAEKRLDRKLNELIYIALTDHISFAVHRFHQNIIFDNPMSWEIKTLYKEEYNIGLWMLDCIEDQFQIRLPESEAAFIALHLVNASLGLHMNNTVKITKLTHELLKHIETYFDLTFDEDSLHYMRLVTHLKFFSQRLFSNETSDATEDDLSTYILNLHTTEAACVTSLSTFIKTNYDYTIQLKEQAYLALHVHRILTEK